MDERFTDILRSLYEGTLMDLAVIGSEVLENPVSVVNASYRILAASKTSSDDDTFYNTFLDKNYIAESCVTWLRQNRIMTRLGMERKAFIQDHFPGGCRMICSPVSVNRILAGIIFVPELHRTFTDEDVRFCDYLAWAVSVEMQKNDDYIIQDDSAGESFFDDLLEQRQADGAEIEARLHSLKIHIKDYKAVLAVTFKEKGMSDKMYMTLQKGLRENCKSPLCIYKRQAIVLLLSENTREAMDKSRASIEDFCRYRHVNAGISRVFTDISQTPLYYGQVLGLLSLADYLCMDRNVYDFEDFLTYHLLHHCTENNIGLDDYISQDILTLKAYDQKHDAQLSKTLHTYMLNLGNAVATVKQLNIHRNTFYYRLNKI